MIGHHNFVYPADCWAFEQDKLSFQQRAFRGLPRTRVSLVLSRLLTLQFSHITADRIQRRNSDPVDTQTNYRHEILTVIVITLD